jgi:chromosome segregation ATPase
MKRLARCRQQGDGCSQVKRRNAMVPTMLRRVAACVVLAALAFGVSGCGVKQSEYDAKVAETKSQTEKVSQLQKDLDSVKSEVDKAKQARKQDAIARTKALEQETAALKDQVKTLEQANAGLKANAERTASQHEKDLDAARGEIAKVEQARKAAEAKIKALEQENADLRKKANAKPLDFLKKKT